MKYQTAKEAADRLGVTARAVQKWAKQGKISGACLHSNVWMIPENFFPEGYTAEESTAEELNTTRVPLPFLCGSFEPGKAKEFIDNITDADDRAIALAEYYYYTGNMDKTVELLTTYISSEDKSLRYSAEVMETFSNIFLGRIHVASSVSAIVSRAIAEKPRESLHPAVYAFRVLTSHIGSTILRLPMPPTPKLEDWLYLLPNGHRLYACYILAFEAYKKRQYSRATGICEIAMAMCNSPYPIPLIYTHIIAAASYIHLKDNEAATFHFQKAWDLAYPDGFLSLFAVHYKLLQGLLEIHIKEEYPDEYKKIISMIKQFYKGWNNLHVLGEEDINISLSPMEITIALLYNEGLQKKEIAQHLNTSLAYVKKQIQIIYERLGVQSKAELNEYLSN